MNYSDPTGNNAATIQDLNVIFGKVIAVVLGLAGIALFVMLLVGGFKFISAGGDPKAMEEAKKTLTYAIGGLVLVAVAFLIIQIIYNITTGTNFAQFNIMGI